MKMSGKRKMEIVEKECRECNICKKFKRKPRRPIVGLNLAENFNEVLAIDLGELEGEKFIVMVDWATRYSQAAWIKSNGKMGKLFWTSGKNLVGRRKRVSK